MRDIKFRAWDYGELYYDVGVTPHGVLIYEDTKGKMVKPNIIGEIGIDCDGLIVEQYTGLKDKNGKDIYEGDIAKHKISGAIVKVIFQNRAFIFFHEHSGRELKDIGSYELELIGNIHEGVK